VLLSVLQLHVNIACDARGISERSSSCKTISKTHELLLSACSPFQAYRMEAAQTSTSATSSAASSVDGRSGGAGGADYLNLGMFGQSSGVVGDLLLGPGSFGGSLGNGFGNDSGTSNTSSSVSGSNGASAFDLSDFPSLGGGTGNNNGPASNGGLSAALRQQQQQQQQQQLLAHQQMLQGSNSKSPNLYRMAMSTGANGGSNFTMATEDFPALPGAPSGTSNSNNGSATSTSPLLLGATNTSTSSGTAGYVTSTVSRTSGAGIYGSDLDNGSSQLDGSGLLGGAGFGGLQTSLSSGASTSISARPTSVISSGAVGLPSSTALGTAGSVAGTALSGDYGLLGLLGVIRMTDVDRNALALGSDLTMLGLNLGSSEQLYSTFSSPWSEAAATKEPHYKVSYVTSQLSQGYYFSTRNAKTEPPF
jgi:CCR4-NOT transcription complex subunit 2